MTLFAHEVMPALRQWSADRQQRKTVACAQVAARQIRDASLQLRGSDSKH
jgi:hypothetical protein